MSTIMKEIAAAFKKALEHENWVNSLLPQLQTEYFTVYKELTNLNSLLLKYQHQRISLDDLKQIKLVWEKELKHLKIKYFELIIDGQGYKEYEGMSFRSLEELCQFIESYNSTELNARNLAEYHHSLSIEFLKD